MTQKQKLADYDRLASERDLLSLYFYDQETNVDPDTFTREGSFRVLLYRAMAGHGGYVVVHERGVSPRIHYFEQFKDAMAQHYDNDTLPLRICLDRIWSERAKLYARRVGQ
jgi:hypothetical protein